MHPSAMKNCQSFFDTYAGAFAGRQGTRVIEIGAQDVNGSLRATVPAGIDYVGVDFVAGKGVDVVLDDPYALPFADASADIVISSSCFEHSEMFWLVFLEIMRILKPDGLFYLNVPSNGNFHRYPVDCWRFYPDSGGALVSWARRNGMAAVLLESYTSLQEHDIWNDYVAVFLRDEARLAGFPTRILDSRGDITNGRVHGRADVIRPTTIPEDRRKLEAIGQIIANKIRIVE